MSKLGHNNEVLFKLIGKGEMGAYCWHHFSFCIDFIWTKAPRGTVMVQCFGAVCLVGSLTVLLLCLEPFDCFLMGQSKIAFFLPDMYFISLNLVENMYKIYLKPKAPEMLGNFFLNLCFMRKNATISLIKVRSLKHCSLFLFLFKSRGITSYVPIKFHIEHWILSLYNSFKVCLIYLSSPFLKYFVCFSSSPGYLLELFAKFFFLSRKFKKKKKDRYIF